MADLTIFFLGFPSSEASAAAAEEDLEALEALDDDEADEDSEELSPSFSASWSFLPPIPNRFLTPSTMPPLLSSVASQVTQADVTSGVPVTGLSLTWT